MPQQRPNLDKYGFPLNAPASPGDLPQKQVAWEWGMRQKVQTKQIKLSNANIKSPFKLSSQASAQGAIGNGTTLNFNTTLTPNAPHANEMNLAIPYVAIYWNTAGVGSLQIWPTLGAGIPGTAFSVHAGYDYHLFSSQTPGSVSASFSGKITDNNMGNGTIQLVTLWQWINLNTGTATPI